MPRGPWNGIPKGVVTNSKSITPDDYPELLEEDPILAGEVLSEEQFEEKATIHVITPIEDGPSGDAVLDAFPFETFRRYQRRVLLDIQNVFWGPNQLEAMFVQAPVGAGKSPLAIAITQACAGGGWILTPQKTLQDQYIRDFDSELVDFRGRGNYPCQLLRDQEGCDTGPCVVTGTKCMLEHDVRVNREVPTSTHHYSDGTTATVYCDYYAAKEAAVRGPITLTNYSVLLAHGMHGQPLPRRDVLILDEAHRTEEILMSTISFTINQRFLDNYAQWGHLPKDLPAITSIEDFAVWLVDKIVDGLGCIVVGLQAFSTNAGASDIPSVRAFQRAKSTLSRIRSFLRRHGKGELWVLCPSNNALTAKPLFVSQFGQKVFEHGKRILLFSGTILAPDVMASSLGLSPGTFTTRSLPSSFPLETRPFVWLPQGRMTKRFIEKTLPKALNGVEEIARHHAREKGVIHTHTFKIAEAVADRLGGRALTHTSRTREDVLHHFLTTSEPKILVTPSMTDGLDLPGDQGRWQIIMKCPFPDLGDPQVRARTNVDQEWYNWKTCVALVQATGRVVRSPSDYGVTYMLDSAIADVVTSNWDILPKYFLDPWRAAVEKWEQKVMRPAATS